MTTTAATTTAAETIDRRLSDEQCEQLGEWLVRSNGEGCDLLDCYAVELEAGWDVVLDLDPGVPTRADEQRVTGAGEPGDRDRPSARPRGLNLGPARERGPGHPPPGDGDCWLPGACGTELPRGWLNLVMDSYLVHLSRADSKRGEAVFSVGLVSLPMVGSALWPWT